MSRLIDADLLKDNVLKWLPKDMDELNDSGIPPIENLVVSLMMEIEEQPTAFDVEEVVKELEESRKDISTNTSLGDCFKIGYREAITEAIEIVEKAV